MKLLQKLKCWFFGHTWTCNATEGIAATKEQLESGVMGFADYAKMYCKKCGKYSQLNNRLNKYS